MERLIDCVVTDEKHLKTLQDLGILTIEQLCTFYPHKYNFIEKTGLVANQVCTLEGQVISNPKANYGRIPRFGFEFLYEEGKSIDVVVFHRSYLMKQLSLNKKVTIVGKYNEERNSFVANEIIFKTLDECLKITPIYSLKGQIEQQEFYNYIKKAFDIVSSFEDVIPKVLLDKYSFHCRDKMLRAIHFPTIRNDIEKAIEYIKYEQFYLFQLTMQYSKVISEKRGGIKKSFSMVSLQEFINTLSFELTRDQSLTVSELLADLQSEKAMYRFVQGDVGSGKTVVALIGMYASFLAGFQSAFMVPTEILARQQYENLEMVFSKFGVRVALLTGSMPKKERDYVLNLLSQGYIDVLVGTHSLFQDKVVYSNLGFVVADEQHRFGVRQRKALKEKGEQVDFLLMSATPIPRTLAMSLYGDMDVSTIETMPSDRKGIETHFIESSSMQSILPELESYLDQGGQCYVVCPLVENQSDKVMRDASSIFEGIKNYYNNKYEVGLLHGQMSDEQKANTMKKFENNVIQIIVATTVIEVGINVQNANRMIIYNAERFGISQLHQLRGRIGRGNEKGVCFLLSKTEDVQSKEKLSFLTTCHNGFDVSRYDLQIRGPGDLLGDRQSGLPNFTFSDLYKDANVLEQARNDVRVLLATNCEDSIFINQLERVSITIKKNNQYVD